MPKFLRVPGILLGLALAMPAGISASPAASASEKPRRPLEVTVCSITHTDKDAAAKLDLLKSLGVTSIQTSLLSG